MRDPLWRRLLNSARRPRSAIALAAVILVAAALLMGRGGGPGNENLDLLLSDLEEQVREDPQNAAARIGVAAAYFERGLVGDSIEQFDQALLLEPDNQAALIGLAQAHLSEGDLVAAEELLRTVAEMNEDNEFKYTIERLAGVYYDLAGIELERENFDEARDQLLEALIITPSDADTLRRLGQVEEHAGNLDAAQAAYASAVRFVPNYLEVYRDLERVYERMGLDGARDYAAGMVRLTQEEPEAAIKHLERAVAGDAGPALAASYEGLAMAYEEAGRVDDALTAYRSALTVNPEMFLSGLAISRLEAR